MYEKLTGKKLRALVVLHCKIILFVAGIRYPQYPRYTYPIFMLLKYIKITKAKDHFKIVIVPRRLIELATNRNCLVAIDNCILINASYHRAILNSTEFAQLTSDDGKRLVQVVPTELISLRTNEIIASSTFRKNCRLKRCQVLPVDIRSIKVCSKVDVSMLTHQYPVGASVIDLLLKNYFRNPKLLYKNDILSICLEQHAPEFYYTNLTVNETKLMHFKCNQISITGIDDCLDGYLCVLGESTLKLSVDIQDSIPESLEATVDIQHVDALYHDDYKNCIISSCPFGLEQYCSRLEVAAKPFLRNVKLKLNPIFLLSGAKGSGKQHIVESLAAKLGMKMCRASNIDLSSQAYAQTELKMKTVFFRAKVCAPCVFVINNFEELCKNNEGQHDHRIINHFKNELQDMFSTTERPIILICLSNAKDLLPDLGRMFLESVHVEAPSQNEREQLLQWILTKNVLKTNYVKEIAAKTHGFLFEDLEALVFYATDKETSLKGNVSGEDFERALDIMQNSYTESLGAPKVPKVQWSDVGGLEDVKKEIIKTINLPLKHPELLKTGLKRSGILLYGPPGTGKTLLAKAVANECGLCFLSVKGPELLNMYVGQSEQNVRDVFEKARAAAPCIIFFDELDSLAPNRGISGDSGGVMDRVVSQLLAEMDGLNQNATLFVIGATNRPDLIDPALLRPGRFDKLLFVGACTDFTSKLSVLKALTRRFKFSDKLSLDKVVKACPDNITGADFYGICSNAWMSAASRLVRKIEKGKVDNADNLSEKDVVVTFKDFEEAIKITKPSVSTIDMMYFEKLRSELSANAKK